MPVIYPPITEALESYDPSGDEDRVQQAEQQRADILNRFARETWPFLPLERYALGTPYSKESYCRWLEFRSMDMGSMSGGSALKHIIYKHRSGEWRWSPPDAYQDADEAWNAVRSGFGKAFELADLGKYEEIDHIEALRTGPALRTKTLHVYYPQDVLPVYSRDHLLHFLRLLDRPEGRERTYEVVRLNRSLLEALRTHPKAQGLSSVQLGFFLYRWADPRTAQRVVKIAPGKEARYWDDCLAGGYICVGWDTVGDLSNFDSKTEFRRRFEAEYQQRYTTKSKMSAKANELWTLRELQPGDKVIANRGTSEVLAIGEVVEPGYEWRPDREEYKHTVRVKWDTTASGQIPSQGGWGTTTVSSIKPELYAKILENTKEGQTDPSSGSIPAPALFTRTASALERKGQVILYGPPGTGKTYHARRFATWWLSQELKPLSEEAILADEAAFSRAEMQLSTAQVTRRVWWIVANPSNWAWSQLFEDHRVEYRYGRLQRNYPLVQEGDLVVGYQANPDKRIVALARVTKGLHLSGSGDKVIELEPLAPVENGLPYEELSEDPLLREAEPLRFRNQGTLFALEEPEADRLFSLLLERNPNLSAHLSSEEQIGPLTRVTFHPSYSYEDFIEGFRPVEKGDGLVLRLVDGVFKRICREAQTNPNRRYVLLIDEVNRANVAKVFGEIITLLEMDKRGLAVTLPQSKESFFVPSNVFIVATMNTADRSIRLLDAALRRRFAFMELMPDSSTVQGAQVGPLPLDEFLDELNRRVTEREGREKQIGHSFLLAENGQPVQDPDDFANRFRQEIIPLLQEYCYDDYSVLAHYIGTELVDENEQTLVEDVLYDTDALIAALVNHLLQPDAHTAL